FMGISGSTKTMLSMPTTFPQFQTVNNCNAKVEQFQHEKPIFPKNMKKIPRILRYYVNKIAFLKKGGEV
ncbi:MAG: hypothetical protein IKU12_03095, partial [Oscillospiraceae bacterium]|nr:hypothetical protein [Oscillospiraceae bacterium]